VSKFISGFAAALDALLDYREALGFSRRTHEYIFQNFDAYAVAHYPEKNILNREIVTEWIQQQLKKSHRGITNKTSAIRLLGKYLSAVGKESYILPDDYISKPQKTFLPYLFTDDELERLFHAADRLEQIKSNPLASKISSVLFRLIYTCGLRPNEGRELRRENINFKTGEILITKTKRKKERVVVMSDDMLKLCKKYNAVLDKLGRVPTTQTA